MKREYLFDIYSISKGKVLFVLPEKEIRNGKQYKSLYGLRVGIINSLDNNVDWYCHLESTYLKPGMIIPEGSIIGEMGNTGCPKQKKLNKKTLSLIKKDDPDLYNWFINFRKSDSLEILDSMELDFLMWDRLKLYLNKHLHFMRTPKDKLSGNYSIDPIPMLLKSTPPTNTKQSIGAGYKAINKKYWKICHEGIDFSGNLKNVIPGWENVSDSFRNNFYNSIDRSNI